MRTVEIYNKGVWTRTPFPKLKQWDIFRMYEPDTGELVDKGTDLEICIITEPPTYVGGKAGWCLQVEGFTNVTTDHLYAKQVRVMADGQQVGCVGRIDMRTHLMVQEVPNPGIYVSRVAPFDYIEFIPPAA